MQVLFARHAESVWNAEGRWQGQADPPLSEAGRRQARSLAEALAGRAPRPGALVASDLARARETAGFLAERLGLALRLDPGLRERDVGVWSGLSREEIARRHPEDLARLRAGDREVRPGGGESTRCLEARVRAALGRLLREAELREGPLLVVSHLGVLRTLRPGAVLANATWVELEPVELGPPAYACPDLDAPDDVL